MIRIERVLTPSEADVKWLEKGCKGSWDGNTKDDQLAAVAEKRCWLFRVSGDAEGVFVIGRGNIKDRELIVTALGGKGFIKHFKEIYSQIKAIAKKNGAKKLSWFASRRGLVRIYAERMKVHLAAVLFVENLG